MDEDVVFEVESVLGGTIVMRDVVWEDVRLRKHRDLNGRLADVQITVSDPDEVRRSTKRPNVFLFYRVHGVRQFVCVVVRSESSQRTYVTSAYDTTRVKEGEILWQR